MEGKMKVALLQQDVVWGCPAQNVSRAEEAMMRAQHADLYVLPEMFSTGFSIEPVGVAERDGFSLQWMKAIAAKLDAAIAGSVAVEVEGGFRNRFYFVKPDGEVFYYDKRHLFSYAGEHLQYTAGEQRVVVPFRGVRFLLQVCYDLRFPVWARNREDYDCILYVANWPLTRILAWRTLLAARAIENQCYVCGVNRVGKDAACHYSGGTMLVHPYGNPLATAKDDQEDCVMGEIDLDFLSTFRQKFPVLKDRDIL